MNDHSVMLCDVFEVVFEMKHKQQVINEWNYSCFKI